MSAAASGSLPISLDAESADGESFVDDRDTVFAYQVGAGIGYEFPLSEGRSLTVSLDWRYFDTQTPTFTGKLTGNEFETEISGHDIGIGLMYGFLRLLEAPGGGFIHCRLGPYSPTCRSPPIPPRLPRR